MAIAKSTRAERLTPMPQRAQPDRLTPKRRLQRVGHDTAAALVAEIEVLQAEVERLRDEKRRRVYYQDIVYAVCHAIDRINGGTIQCGTIDEPCRDVQEASRGIVAEIERLRGACTLMVAVNCPGCNRLREDIYAKMQAEQKPTAMRQADLDAILAGMSEAEFRREYLNTPSPMPPEQIIEIDEDGKVHPADPA